MSEVEIIKKDIDCPHCKGKIDVEFERKKPKIMLKEENTQEIKQITKNIESPEQEQPKKLTHEELASFMPKGLNAMSCPGGDCGHKKLKNPKQVKKFKTCPHCTANTVTKGSDFCPYCTKNLDEDEELEDGVELEEEEKEDDE